MTEWSPGDVLVLARMAELSQDFSNAMDLLAAASEETAEQLEALRLALAALGS